MVLIRQLEHKDNELGGYMSTVVYLSNNSIKVLTGEQKKNGVQVDNIYLTLAPEGSIINGIVTDQEEFLSHLKEFWEMNRLPKKGISLVINSSQFVNRTMELPEMSDKEILNYISREFSDVERTKNPVYNFFVLSKDERKKSSKIFATMVEKSFLDEHIQMFSALGISISSIDSANGCAIRILQQLPKVQKGACIVQLLDDMNMTNFLFIDGVYEYSSRSRIFNDRGTFGFGAEVARSVSNLLQFAQAQHFKERITNVYLGGIFDDELSFCEQSILEVSQTLSVSILDGTGTVFLKESLDGYKKFSNCVYAVGGLISLKKQLDLYTQYLRDPEKEHKKKETLKAITPIIVLFSIAVVISIGLGVRYTVLKGRLDKLDAYNTNTSIVDAGQEYDSLQEKESTLEKKVDKINEINENIKSYPIANSKVIKVLEKCASSYADIEVTSFEAETGILQVLTTASDVDKIHQYVLALRNEEIFKDVEYTGYNYLEDSKVYQINVICYLSQGAGHDKKEN